MIRKVEYSTYSVDYAASILGDRSIFVVFSTFGERESDLIYDKISLLRKEGEGLIKRIVLSHRRAGTRPERTEKRAREAWEGTDILICNDYPVPDMEKEKGKGADMRRALYHINRDLKGKEHDVVLFLDADVVPEYFGTHFLTALAGAVLEGDDFAKASFWRAMGRVKKFVAQPLFSLVDHPELGRLRDLHYPLSGEVAGTVAFFNSVSFWQMYGVETGINIDALMGDYSVADVNLGLYDHEHHGDIGIQKMSFGIMRTWLKQLMDYGLIELKDGASLSDTFRASLIDDKEKREEILFDLSEKKYPPLKEVLPG
jgi:glucosyl-3-phosphoglycerate synthase